MVMCEGTCVLIMRIMLLRLLLWMMLFILDKHKHEVVVLPLGLNAGRQRNNSNDTISAAKTLWNLITPSLSFNKRSTFGTPNKIIFLYFSSKKGKPKNHQQKKSTVTFCRSPSTPDTGCLGYSTERSALKH